MRINLFRTHVSRLENKKIRFPCTKRSNACHGFQSEKQLRLNVRNCSSNETEHQEEKLIEAFFYLNIHTTRIRAARFYLRSPKARPSLEGLIPSNSRPVNLKIHAPGRESHYTPLSRFNRLEKRRRLWELRFDRWLQGFQGGAFPAQFSQPP